jgi:hypothetical protein
MTLNPTEKQAIVDEVVRIVRSKNRDGILESLREQQSAPPIEGDLAADSRSRDAIILAIAEAVLKLEPRRGTRDHAGSVAREAHDESR